MGEDVAPDMVAGHSLGEFSALVAAGALNFEDGLKLVYARAMAMQKACEGCPFYDGGHCRLGMMPQSRTSCAEINTENNVVVPAKL